MVIIMIRRKLSTLRNNIAPMVSTWKWWMAGGFAVLIQQLTMGWLNGLYEATEFPVSYMVGQTAFSGELIKSYYAVLLEKGTFESYINVQLVDYLFMVTVFMSHALVCIAIYLSVPNKPWLKSLAWTMVILTPLAAVADAFENLVSFFMLADPDGFANWLAYPYSAFAVLKFALFTLFMVWTTSAILICIGSRFGALFNRRRIDE